MRSYACFHSLSYGSYGLSSPPKCIALSYGLPSPPICICIACSHGVSVSIACFRGVSSPPKCVCTDPVYAETLNAILKVRHTSVICIAKSSRNMMVHQKKNECNESQLKLLGNISHFCTQMASGFLFKILIFNYCTLFWRLSRVNISAIFSDKFIFKMQESCHINMSAIFSDKF